MRQLLISVPRRQGQEVLDIAEKHGGSNLVVLEGRRGDRDLDLVLIHVANRKVEDLLEDLEGLPDLHVTLTPRGVLALRPPAGEAPEQVTEVTERSPVEIFLGGLQSIGSWRGFLGYAAAAGVVVWIGLFTNTSYLLVAAMLIAPFAGPAMNVALGSARGDKLLIERGVLRYFAALAVTIAVAFLLSLLLGQEVATEQMIERSQVSTVAVLLPLVAGAAGALNLVQSERSSLVSGAATGMLVEANLRFTRADNPGQNILLGIIYVQRGEGINVDAETIRQELTGAIQREILAQGFSVTPLIDVVVLEPPAGDPPD